MPITLGELAARFACDLVGDPDIVIGSLGSLADAKADSLAFLSNSALQAQLSETKAAAVVVHPKDADECPVAALVNAAPYAAFARMAALIHPPPLLNPGVHPAAFVDDSATVADSAEIAALAFIGANSVVGENVYVGPGCVIGTDCSIGDDSRLVANVSMPRKVVVGKRGVFHPGSVIGGDGFGNARTPDGWVKVPQVGGVQVGDDVEIGCNSTIDCGAFGDTRIGDGVRIDNLCMVGHNVVIGAHTAMAAGAGIAGSAVIGARCMLAGQCGIAGHISICDDVVISGKGMVTKNIREPGVYASNFPAEKVQSWNRRVAQVKRLDKLIDRVSKLEKGQDD